MFAPAMLLLFVDLLFHLSLSKVTPSIMHMDWGVYRSRCFIMEIGGYSEYGASHTNHI